jgi:hypothetical protein
MLLFIFLGGKTEENETTGITSSVEKIFIPPIREFYYDVL